jgi:hypothetical protein
MTARAPFTSPCKGEDGCEAARWGSALRFIFNCGASGTEPHPALPLSGGGKKRRWWP